MGDRRQPSGYERLATKTGFSDEHVPAAIKVIRIIEWSDSIFFCPVHLEITKSPVIKTSDKRYYMRIAVDVLQIGAMFGKIAFLTPCRRYERGRSSTG